MTTQDAVFSELEDKMNKTILSLKKELSTVRTGRAHIGMLDRIEIEYYGTPTDIKHIANVTVPDSRTLLITPYEKNTLTLIEKAIFKSDLGITPNNDGQSIRLNVPQLTQERRNEFKKITNKISEEAKVAIRNERRHAVDKLKKMEKDHSISEDDSKKAQDKAQKLTDRFITDIDKLAEAKIKEISEI